MITPARPVRTRLIHISPSSWTIFRSFQIILERELSIALEFKFNVLCKSIGSKNVNLIRIIFEKCSLGSLSSNG